MKTRVFLDLEGTVINNWDDLDLEWQKCRALHKFLSDFTGTLEVFSFALYNEEDRQRFIKERIAKRLEDAMGFEVTAFPLTVDDIRAAVEVSRGLFFDTRNEFIQLLGKQEGFIQWAQTQSAGKFVLIDDMVDDILFTNKTKGTEVALFNINTVVKEWL